MPDLFTDDMLMLCCQCCSWWNWWTICWSSLYWI